MTTKKRTDSKGRVLKTGESQRKDGRYQYQYTDIGGKRRCVYSLALSDLRQQEKKIQRDIEDGIRRADSKKITLSDLIQIYLEGNLRIKATTKANYISHWETHIKNSSLGNTAIADIRSSDIVRFYNKLSEKLALNTISLINSMVQPSFEMAVEDDLIRKNPCKGAMRKIVGRESVKKNALTVEEQRIFIEFVSTHNVYSKYLPLFVTLLGTGMRIGECLGLTWENIDFKNSLIYVEHTLQYKDLKDVKGHRFFITEPKTESGKRVIPMITDVKQQLLKQKEKFFFLHHGKCCIVDGYTNFVFLTPKGTTIQPCDVNLVLNRVVSAYNTGEEKSAKIGKRTPVLLPHMSNHILRHTFCTRFCENESNVKVIQEIMGHSDINVTMNTYNHVTVEKAKEVMEDLEGKISIS